MTEPRHDDTPARREIRQHLDATLFVEAGAGTGKTTALVGRIVELVADGRARLRSIAAITFTEAAAGELRDRVREALERLAAGEHDPEYAPTDLDDDGRARRQVRAGEALTEVDAAAITTLHGFAQRILSEHPFEAGLPPTFDVYDEIRSSVAFDERWSDFLDRLLDDPAHTASLQRALVTGITLDHLRSVALEFNRNWDLVADARLAAPAPVTVDPGAVLAAIDEATRALGWCVDHTDKLVAHIEGLSGFRSRLGAATGELDRLQLLTQAPKLTCSYGRKDSWQGHVGEVRDQLAAAEDARRRIVSRVSEQALAHLLVAVQALTLAAADDRRRDGTLEFHDLLVQARNLLRRHPEVAGTLHHTYRHLLIDEFQDTDPIQAELAVRIATDDANAASKHWTELSFPPGALFFVGDAKQAIYRFRRADIGLFLEVRATYVDDALALTRNRRSVPGIIDWVNAMFAGLIGNGVPGVQPPYDPLVPHRPPHAHGPDSGPPVVPVVVLGQAVEEQNLPRIRATEAADIATTVARIRDERWPVGDDGRAARLADICVLIPTRTSLPALEDALETAGLPYRVESSSLVYASPEIRDLLTVLRAVDDPTD
ncbi:MAG TPA: UvrD-helicase domain-containing protein, partial [Acidimicrobiales bacterium]